MIKKEKETPKKIPEVKERIKLKDINPRAKEVRGRR